MTKKRRKDCFWGMHSDFHAHPNCGAVIGATLKEEDIRTICEKAKPDFIQIDCKGHPGYASYPSNIGNAMPEMAFDTLEMWRRVTKEYGVLLYMHFSGVQDAKYCIEHPDDAAVTSDGHLSRSVRVDKNGKYIDEYFIPQVCELVEKYDIDGLWIDGDCWSVTCDYRPESLKRFETKTGISLNGFIPAKKGDPYFEDYLEFTREEYREYLRYYVDKLHEKFPELDISVNWAFSDHMPESVSANVDFLSGDLDPNNSFNSARYAGRMLAMHDKPWDIMSWGFRYQIYNDVPLLPLKHPVQLMQEAAAIIALGGKYQNLLIQFSDGSPDIDNILMDLSLADFVRERRPYCYDGKIIDQAVMLVPSYDRYKEMTAPFTREGKDRFIGLTALLCDSGESLSMVNEAILKDNIEKYPLVIIPELYTGMASDTVEMLRTYVLEGGSLMVIGTKAARLLSEAGFPYKAEEYTEYPSIPAGMDINGTIGYIKRPFSNGTPSYLSVDSGSGYGVTFGALTIKTDVDASVVAKLHPSIQDKVGSPVATVIPYGKGKLGVIGANLGTQYFDGAQFQHREIIRKMTAMLYNPVAKIESADGLAEIVCLSVDGKLMLQVVNSCGLHSNPRCATEDYISPLENVIISIREDINVSSVILQPENTHLETYSKEDRIYFKIPRVNIHSIAEINVK